MSMPIIEAKLGESVHDFLQRAIKEVNEGDWNGNIAKHNDVKVRVWKGSLIEDICDKYDLQVKIIRLEHSLTSRPE